METFSLEGREYVALYQLLKLMGWCSSGGEAKQVIAAGEVQVDQAVELRKRCKVRVGQVVSLTDNAVQIMP